MEDFLTGVKLVLQDVSTPVWNTNTFGAPSHHVKLVTDGSLVVQDENNTLVWSSNTPGDTLYAELNTEGDIVVVQTDGKVIVT